MPVTVHRRIEDGPSRVGVNLLKVVPPLFAIGTLLLNADCGTPPGQVLTYNSQNIEGLTPEAQQKVVQYQVAFMKETKGTGPQKGLSLMDTAVVMARDKSASKSVELGLARAVDNKGESYYFAQFETETDNGDKVIRSYPISTVAGVDPATGEFQASIVIKVKYPNSDQVLAYPLIQDVFSEVKYDKNGVPLFDKAKLLRTIYSSPATGVSVIIENDGSQPANPFVDGLIVDIFNWGVIPAGAAPLETSTPTLPAITKTPSPTRTPVPATKIEAPTATEIVTPESIDLKPNYEQTVSVEYMGVQINASLITDKSLDPVIKKVTVGENAYAEFVARSVYGVWAKNHLNQTFETYMRMISEVQRDERNPLDIAIPVYANDTRDGVPYQNSDKSVNPAAQKKYLIIPWYQGEAPVSSDGTEVRSVAEINIALVNGKKVKNITLFEGNDYGDGMGINLDDTVLTFYGTAETIPNYPNKIRNTAAILSCMKWWMIKNSGRSTIGYPTAADESFIKLLVSGGLTLE